MSPMKLLRNCMMALISVFVTAVLTPLSAEELFKADLDALRQSLLKYQNPYTAIRDGYFSTLGCVHYDGMKMEGHAEYAKGAMGVHFLNPSLVGPKPDPMRPALLTYEPVNGKLELVGVEWVVPLASGIKERPQLFGQPFLGPMEGHEPIIPKEFLHYDLHAWLFKENRLECSLPRIRL